MSGPTSRAKPTLLDLLNDESNFPRGTSLTGKVTHVDEKTGRITFRLFGPNGSNPKCLGIITAAKKQKFAVGEEYQLRTTDYKYIENEATIFVDLCKNK